MRWKNGIDPAEGPRVLREQGLRRFLAWLYGAGLLLLNQALAGIRPLLTFTCGGRRYRYFCHDYNGAWLNERTVEIPLVRRHLLGLPDARVLEVGNVLSWYFPAMSHVVIDKYEAAPRVRNVDVVDFRPAERFDLIVSVSTLEHVGFDEAPRDPAKPERALRHLRSLLAPHGRLVITFPLGHNPAIDELWLTRRDLFHDRRCLKRISRFNFWREIPLAAVENPRYGSPYMGGNWVGYGVVVAEDAPASSR